jgi:hypothetical protein
MENPKTDDAGESELRGGALDGPEQERAAGHTVYKKKHNPDTIVRVDGEPDTLYQDGIDT